MSRGNLPRSLDVVAVLLAVFIESQSYFHCGRRAAQFHLVLIVVSPLNALDQIEESMLLEKRIAF